MSTMIQKDKYDTSIALIRVIMCFEVILAHGWKPEDLGFLTSILYTMRKFPATVFMVLALYLTTPLFHKIEKVGIKKRFSRLIIPQIGWTLIYWLVLCVLPEILKHGRGFRFDKLLLQMFLGYSINSPMWFQVSLIIQTVIMLVVYKLFPNRHNIVIWIGIIVCLILQYTEINALLFEGFRTDVSIPLGRIVELFPIAACGVFIYEYKLIDYIRRKRLVTILLSCVVYYIVGKMWISTTPKMGFDYQGIGMILGGLAIVFIGVALKFDILSERKMIIYKKVTGFTLGIYCTHKLVISILDRIWPCGGSLFGFGTVFMCIVVYLICYIIAVLGFSLFRKTWLRMMFN